LLTLGQPRLPVKIVVFNNGALSFMELEMKAAGIVTFGTEIVELGKTNLRRWTSNSLRSTPGRTGLQARTPPARERDPTRPAGAELTAVTRF